MFVVVVGRREKKKNDDERKKFFLDPKSFDDERTTHLVRRGRAEPHERAHGVGSVAEEFVLLVARDLGSWFVWEEGKGKEKKRERRWCFCGRG